MAIENLKNVIENEETPVDTVVTMTVGMAAAYQEDEKATKHIQEVKKELEDRAEEATPEVTAEENKLVDNEYTKEVKLTLDESLTDFVMESLLEADEIITDVKTKDGRSNKTFEDDDEDDYLDYDMFNFIYGLVTDTWPKPKNPLGKKRMRKFQYTGSDDYLDSNSPNGHSQVASSGNTITVYANEIRDFDDIKAVCDLYQFTYKGPVERQSSVSHWKYSFTIDVPMAAEDYPMMVEDYFEGLGMTLSDVMPASWVAQYNKATGKIEKEQSSAENEFEVQRIFNDYVKKAANSNDPLDGFINDMFAEMSSKGLTYKRNALKKQFKAEFEDDFED